MRGPRALGRSRREAAACDLVAGAVQQFGALRLRVLGRSMLPAIWPGDVLEVERVAVTALRRSDVILVRRGAWLFAHRLIEVSRGAGGDLLLTRGDAQRREDPPVPAGHVVGRVAAVRRGPFRLNPRQPPGAGWRMARSAVEAGLRVRRFVAATGHLLVPGMSRRHAAMAPRRAPRERT